jgi:hypothetical protein
MCHYCTVSGGQCRIVVKINRLAMRIGAAPIKAGMNAGYEIFKGGVSRYDPANDKPPPAFEAGLLVKADSSPLMKQPRIAEKASGSLVVGYRKAGDDLDQMGCGLANKQSTSYYPGPRDACAPVVRNDPACTFKEGSGRGSGEITVEGSDVTIDVSASGIECTGLPPDEPVVLCLSASQRITTEDTEQCADHPPCTVVVKEDEPIGLGYWNGENDWGNAGCCKVGSDGSCRIRTSIDKLSHGLIKPGQVSAGAFFRTGLIRVRKINVGGNDVWRTIEDVDPAFMVGVLVP